ncbi:MAG: bacterioferritin [Planctomycetes bacterium]|nr:bacterioferritin [Planctomycetota bacterium]
MKGDRKIIEHLNEALTVELTAINQYFVQARTLKAWGYAKLAGKMYQESIGEMKHAEALIDRVLFLEGVPNITRYNQVHLGADVKAMLQNDLKLETSGVTLYNGAIEACSHAKDAGSREILEHILVNSEEHVDWLETQMDLIEGVGIENYLAQQMGGGEGAKG